MIKKIFRSRWTNYFACFGIFISGLAIISLSNSFFDHYFRRSFYSFFSGIVEYPIDRTDILLAQIFLSMFSIIFFWSSWERAIKPRNIMFLIRIDRREDYFLLIFSSILILFVLRAYMFDHLKGSTIILTLFISLKIVLDFIDITIYRIRNKTFMKNLLWVDFYENMPFFSRKSLGVTFLLFFTVFFSRLIISVSEMYYIYLTLAVVLFAILTSIADHYTQFEKIKKEIDTAKKEDRKIDLNQMVLSEEMSVLANELSQLSNSYETALLDQMRAERLKTDLITNVSHDIKTPLTSIINYVDLLKKLDIDHNQLKEFTSILENKSQRLKNLVDDLLEASKASSGSIEMKIESINIVELAGQIAGEFDESFLQNNLTLIENYPDQAFIFADSRYLWRVVENIFGNTAKYAMPDTRVYSQIMNQNGNVIFTLKNVSKIALNISADELTEQFIRGDRSRSTEGSGLGLYIAKSLIENMNGKIDVLINGDLFEVKITLPIVTEK